MPFRENDLEAVTKRGALQVWQAEFRRSTRLRRMRAIHRGGRGILREGVNFEDVDAVREPAPRGRAKILSGRGLNAPQGNFVGVGTAFEDLAAGQAIGLAAESADALDAAHEIRHVFGLGTLELMLGGPGFQEARQFFVGGLLDGCEVAARFSGSADQELAADLALVLEDDRVSGDLIV